MLDQEDLEKMGCGTPGCVHDHTELFFRSQCHPKKRFVQVVYDKRTKAVTLLCAECDAPIASFAVAAKKPTVV